MLDVSLPVQQKSLGMVLQPLFGLSAQSTVETFESPPVFETESRINPQVSLPFLRLTQNLAPPERLRSVTTQR